MADWLKGCEVCNAGLVSEMDRLVDLDVPVQKAAKILAKQAAKELGNELYSAISIQNRYRYYTNKDKRSEIQTRKTENPAFCNKSSSLPLNEIQQEPVEKESYEAPASYHTGIAKDVAQAKRPQKSELEIADSAIEKAARFLDRIVSGDIKDNGTQEDKLFAQSIIRQGPGIIINFMRLGIDLKKAEEFYHGNSNKQRTGKIKGTT